MHAHFFYCTRTLTASFGTAPATQLTVSSRIHVWAYIRSDMRKVDCGLRGTEATKLSGALYIHVSESCRIVLGCVKEPLYIYLSQSDAHHDRRHHSSTHFSCTCTK